MTTTTDAPAVISYGQDRNLPDPEGWVRGTIPVVVVEDMRTGDGRLIPAGSLSGHRALPLALLSLSRTSEGGHLDATVFGRIDHLERVPGPDAINIDTGQPFPDGTFVWRSNEAWVDPEHPDYRLLHSGALTGISVDLAETEADFEFDEDDPDAEPLLRLVTGRIAASTLCTIPAFPGAHFVLDDGAPAPGAGVPQPAPLAASAAPTSWRLEHETSERVGAIDSTWQSAQTAEQRSDEPGAAGAAGATPPTSPRTHAFPAQTAAHPSTASAASATARPSAPSASPSGAAPSPRSAATGTARTSTRSSAAGTTSGSGMPGTDRTPATSSSRRPRTTVATGASRSPGTRWPSSSPTRTASAPSAAARSSSPPAGAPRRTPTSTTTTSPVESAPGSVRRATAASAASSTNRTFSEQPPTTSTRTGPPPISWFRDPELLEPTPLTVDPDGRCYGHIAIWDSEHIGFTGQRVLPPRSHSDYAHFHTGGAQVIGDDGGTVTISVGRLTLNTGHADLSAGARAAAAHYDDTGTIAALVCAGEDEHGIWFSGAVDPDLDEVGRRRFLACGLSGDWRPIPGLPEPELVAALSVPTPGFPIPRVRVAAAGTPVALVAAGAIRPREDTMADDPIPAEPALEPGTTVSILDTDLMGVVVEAVDGSVLVTVEVPADRLVADASDANIDDELSAVRSRMDEMSAELRVLRAQRVLDRL